MREIVNVISYKLMALFKQKVKGFKHASGENEKISNSTPSITSENAILARRTNITFIIDLVLL